MATKQRFYLLFDPGSRNAGVVSFVYDEEKNAIAKETLKLYTLDVIGENNRWTSYKRKNRQWPFKIGNEIVKRLDLRAAESLNTTVIIERQLRDDFIRVECSFFAAVLRAIPTAEFYSYRMLDARSKLKLHGDDRKQRKLRSIDFVAKTFNLQLSSDHEADCFVLFSYHLSLLI